MPEVFQRNEIRHFKGYFCKIRQLSSEELKATPGYWFRAIANLHIPALAIYAITIYDNYEGNEMFVPEYYETASGERPAEDFISRLDSKMKAKVVRHIKLLERYGALLGAPYSRHLEDGIFELRTSQGNNSTRVLYFFVSGQRVILTHGFIKKTQKTPRSEIRRAKRLRADWKRRNE